MRKHVQRHRKARVIRAAASGKVEMILADAAGVEWIEAQAPTEGESPKPKRFTINAYGGGMLRLSRYDTPVVIDLSGMTAKTPIPILLEHDSTLIVGHADEVVNSESSLKLKGVVSGVGESADKVTAMAANGFPWRASVGAMPLELEWIGDGVTTKANGKSFKGPLYVARKSELKEVSFVAVAADSGTSVKVAASAAHSLKENDMNFQQWVEAMGLVLAELRDDQKAKLQAKYNAELKAAEEKAAADAKNKPIEAGAKTEPPKVEPPKFDLNAVLLVHAKHETAIEAMAAKWQPKIADTAKFAGLKAGVISASLELKAKALAEEWPAARLEAEFIRPARIFEADLEVAERPKAPEVFSSTKDAITGDILAAACLMNGKIAKPEDHYRSEVLQAAHSRFRRGLGLQELFLEAAWANGYSGRSFKHDPEAVLRFAFQPIQAGGFSTVAITGILSNVANKFLLEGFTMVEQTWRAISAIRPVNDFKTVTSYRLTGDVQYRKMAPSGEIEHGTLGEESYTNKAETYARMLAITRPDIINDDLGAISSVPRMLGRGSGLKINDVFWTEFLDNASFFTAGRGNYTSGALTNLSIDSLTAVELLFMDLKDADSKPIGHMPTILLTPTALSATAAALFKSTEIRDTTSSTKYPTQNPHTGKFQPHVSRYLGNSSYTGYSITAFYLLCSPNEVPVIETCFLNGQESPTVETADADFNTLGIQMRGYHDFGVSKQDYRGGVKSKGAA
jgi:phage major head subunit gpT-like protein